MSQRGAQFDPPETSVRKGTNHLLVIGIDAYADTAIPDLRNAVEDAKAFAAVLRDRYDFDAANIHELYDEKALRADIVDEIDAITDRMGEEDSLLVYYAGHGYFRKNRRIGYWVPHDARNGRYSSYITNSRVEELLRECAARHILLIVDCCHAGSMLGGDRSLPFPQNALSEAELKKWTAKARTFKSRYVLAAGRFDETVADGWVGNHSPFANALINALRRNERAALPASELFRIVGPRTTYNADQFPVCEVLRRTGHDDGVFVFDLKRDESREWAALQKAPTRKKLLDFIERWPGGKFEEDALDTLDELEDKARFDRARRKGLAALIRFLRTHPDSHYAEKARAIIAGFEEPEEEPPEPAPKQQAVTAPPTTYPFPVPETVFIKGGIFMMGSEDGDADDDEKPIHEVHVDDFYLGKYPVTFDEYDAFCEATDRKKPKDVGWGRGRRPVIDVSWKDATAYAAWLSEQTGQRWRLPTEAEWEYAAGGGSENRTTWAGTDEESALGDYSWYHSNSGRKTQPVGSKGKRPNALGLYDMSGNVYEWCQDWYGSDYYASCQQQGTVRNLQGPDTGSFRVFRGGSWNFVPRYCRVADRGSSTPTLRDINLGFRLSRTP